MLALRGEIKGELVASVVAPTSIKELRDVASLLSNTLGELVDASDVAHGWFGGISQALAWLKVASAQRKALADSKN